MSATDAVLANLAGHNARVRRLARAYAPKYRPVVLVLGYGEDLSQPEGYTKLKLETINKKAARFRDGKLYSERQLQRLLAELTKTQPSAALKTEPTFGRNGHQGATVRYLNHRVAVDRHGFSVIHDWDAPLDAPEGRSTTLHDTQDVTPMSPQMSPLMSPLSTSSCLSVGLSSSLPPDPGRDGDQDRQEQDQEQEQEPGQDPWFTWFVWRAKSGDLAVFNEMDEGFDARLMPGRALRFDLHPEDGKYIRDTYYGPGWDVHSRALRIAQQWAEDDELAMLGIDRDE